MTPRFCLCLLAVLSSAAILRAEPPAADSATVESTSRKSDRDLSPYLIDKQDIKPDVGEKKRFRLSGPLVRPFKGARLREAPRRFLHVINPFASTEPEQESGAPRASTQAWTTTVGWSTGPSGSDTAITHESKMSLVTVGK